MGFVLANWIALVSHRWGSLGRATRQRHGLVATAFLANNLVPCCCQRGDAGGQQRNTNTEMTPGVIAGIVVVVCLLVFVLSVCFFCKRCKGKKQRSAKEQRLARKYEITQSRPSSAVSIISNTSGDKPRISYNTNDIEIIDEDEVVPSPFSPT